MVFYILSHGHSGSTLLDMMLGAHSQIFGAGELSNIYQPKDDPCVCGASKANCPVWSNFSKDDSIFKIYRGLPRITGKTHIIDSSKDPCWLNTIRKGADVSAIHLKREPLGVYNSVRKKYQVGARAFARQWKERERIISYGKKYVDSITVNYEDLVTSPESTLKYILSHYGLEYEPQVLRFKSVEQHQYQGNRHRLDKNEVLKLDLSYKEQLTFKQKLVFKILTL